MSAHKPLPAAAGALSAQLSQLFRNEAKRRNTSPIDVRKQYVFALFFRRIFADDVTGWTLLGGNALLARTGGGRYTEDIDLARSRAWASTDEIRDELRALVARDVGDRFRFEIEEPKEHDRTDPFGYGTRTAEIRVRAFLGALPFDTFKIDVTLRRHVSGPVELVPLKPVIDHPTLDDLPAVPVVPIENHLADKICALYESHANGVSTRYRDLADIVRIVIGLPIRAAQLAQMIAHESRRRRIEQPTRIISPGGEWATEYPEQAREFAQFPKEFQTLEASLTVTGRCLDDVLSGARTGGEWDPVARAWR